MNGELVGCLGVVGVQVRFQKAPHCMGWVEGGFTEEGQWRLPSSAS